MIKRKRFFHRRGAEISQSNAERIMNDSRLNCITSEVIGAGIEVHKQLGLGLLESAY